MKSQRVEVGAYTNGRPPCNLPCPPSLPMCAFANEFSQLVVWAKATETMYVRLQQFTVSSSFFSIFISLSLSHTPLPTTLAAAAFSFHVLPTIQFIRGDCSRHRGWFRGIPPQRSRRSSPIISSLVEPCPYHRPCLLSRDVRIEESSTFPRSYPPRPNMAESSTLASSCVRDSEEPGVTSYFLPENEQTVLMRSFPGRSTIYRSTSTRQTSGEWRLLSLFFFPPLGNSTRRRDEGKFRQGFRRWIIFFVGSHLT